MTDERSPLEEAVERIRAKGVIVDIIDINPPAVSYKLELKENDAKDLISLIRGEFVGKKEEFVERVYEEMRVNGIDASKRSQLALGFRLSPEAAYSNTPAFLRNTNPNLLGTRPIHFSDVYIEDLDGSEAAEGQAKKVRLVIDSKDAAQYAQPTLDLMRFIELAYVRMDTAYRGAIHQMRKSG